MTAEFKSFLIKHQLMHPKATYLLAVSGGVDSVVMADLFHQAGLTFAIAHVNFQLRGEDSEADAHFVEKLAGNYEVPFHSTKVDTNHQAELKGQSIQLFARDFRYAWFDGLCKKYRYPFLATAHHADDALETMLYNIARGTGLAGLAGIPLKRGQIIRPLLFADKAGILAYAEKKGLEYRKDTSNDSLKYDRNRIRHTIVPKLQELNPNLSKSAPQMFEHLRGTLKLYQQLVEHYRKQLLQRRKGLIAISLEQLMHAPAPETLLYELLSSYGINSSQNRQLFDSILEGHSGKTFASSQWQILLDREEILIRLKQEPIKTSLEIPEDEKHFLLPEGHLHLWIHDLPPPSIPKEKTIAWIDRKKLKFPLTLRRWQEGDYFYPIGMDGHRKKLKDYFTDLKLSRFEKEQIWILESAGQIVWIVGHRMDENFKLTSESRECLEFTFYPTIEKITK
ncbi:MAG: tRNA lysidine(34) synthetase TilS [Bacteroidetes bacterium]|nr:tRNA lysidine(34) synthetase TilS [Bacteroidota bacterium]